MVVLDRTTIYVTPEIKAHIKENIAVSNLSQCFREMYADKYMRKERYIKKMQNIGVEFDYCRDQIRKAKAEENKRTSNIPEPGLKWLNEKAPELFRTKDKHAVLRWFNKEYHLKISMKEFKQILEA